MWYGHLACVCSSTRGCKWHTDRGIRYRDLFFNPLLPPDAPMKLLKDGYRWRILNSVDTSATKPRPSFAQTLRSKICKCLSPILPPTSNNKTSKSHTLLGAQSPRPDENFEVPPPYSAIDKLIPNLPYYPGQIHGKALGIAEVTSSYVWGSSLPFDPPSCKTLVPIHPSVPYHLAFYHLHTARRVIKSLGLEKSTILVPDLTCGGSSGPNGCYEWSSELYFSGQFLQKQEIRFGVSEPGFRTRHHEIAMCPHFTASLSSIRTGMRNWWVQASATLSYQDHIFSEQLRLFRGRTHPYFGYNKCEPCPGGIRWDSAKGRLAQIHNCEFCHCSLESSLEVREQELRVRFTVYRALGAGIDRFEPKWHSLLTGKGTLRPPRKGIKTNDVYLQVMRVAHALKMQGLNWITFRTPHGDFTALPDESEEGDLPINDVKPKCGDWESLC